MCEDISPSFTVSEVFESKFKLTEITFRVISSLMIQSFKGKAAKALWGWQNSKLPAEILQRASDKLNVIDSAPSLDSLRVPPSNHLEALSGNRKGQYSIRINNQWRICFLWKDSNAHEEEITDYH